MSKRFNKYLTITLAVLLCFAFSSKLYLKYTEVYPVPQTSNTASDSKIIEPIKTHNEGNEGHDPSVQNDEEKSQYQQVTTEAKDFTKDVFINNRLKSTRSQQSVLIVSLLANGNSFGSGRSFEDFVNLIRSLKYDRREVNLAFFCGTQDLYESVITETQKMFDQQSELEFGRVTLIRAPFLDSPFKASEHSPKVQRKRRRLIARARNFILFSALENEPYTLFLDADVEKFDNPEMLEHFISSGKDIIVPRVQRGKLMDYDKNSWRGERKTPSPQELEIMDRNEWSKFKFIPKDVPGKMYHLGDHLKQLKSPQSDPDLARPDYTVELDSVGGAVLFMKSLIFKQGVTFPPYYIIGTTWQREEGYDGIETEGICYAAKILGYKCWAMPNMVAQHVN